MAGGLHEFLARDHERLDVLLRSCLRDAEGIWQAKYAEFRGGLLRHISIEERVLFPELSEAAWACASVSLHVTAVPRHRLLVQRIR